MEETRAMKAEAVWILLSDLEKLACRGFERPFNYFDDFNACGSMECMNIEFRYQYLSTTCSSSIST